MYQELYDRMETAHAKIRQFGWSQRENLNVMYGHARDLWNLLNDELIECRRRGRPTQRYKDLEKKLDRHLDSVEQYIMFGTLLGGNDEKSQSKR